MRRVCVTAAAFLAGLAGTADPALSGAFTLAPGETKLFVTGFSGGGDKFFDRDGKLRSRGRYRKHELQIYGEYGARDGLTLFGSAALQKIETRDLETERRKGLGRSEIGARFRLFEQDGWIVSAQGSAVIAGAKSSDQLAVVGEGDDQFDGRGLVAHSFELLGMAAFVDLAVGYRVRRGDPADEVRIDATLGVRPTDRLLLLAQNFNTIGTTRWKGPFELNQRIYKLQGAAIYDLTPQVSLIASGFFTAYGQDALDERGGSLGLGFRF